MNISNQALIPPDENRRMFDTIARRYDLLNSLISLGLDQRWRRKAVDCLNVRAGGHYLDAGCGTGRLSLEIARRFATGAVTITGVDFSEAMVHKGNEQVQRWLTHRGSRGRSPSLSSTNAPNLTGGRASSRAASSITLLVGDALTLPVANHSMDGVISGFVIRNISDRPAALAEWFRVLRPGARCVVLELGLPEQPVVRWMYGVITRLLVPLAARLFSRHEAYRYLLESIRAFPPPEMVMSLFRQAGFVKLQSVPLTFGAVRIYCGTKPL